MVVDGRSKPRTNQPWEKDGPIRKTIWAHELKKAGVFYRNPYQTRQTYASTLLSLGENSMWVAKQMRHNAFLVVVETYLGGSNFRLWTFM
jgi:integrase